MVVYLASAYSFDPEKGFANAVAFLAQSMRDSPTRLFFSPIVHSHHVAQAHGLPTDWEFWREINHRWLSLAGQLWVLHDSDGAWATSDGVADEIREARRLLMPISPCRLAL